MLLALSGVTGIGKSFFAEEISKKLDFKKVTTIRTRAKRPGEENNQSCIFISDQELDKLKSEGKIIYDFKVFGGRYAYLKDQILSDQNLIFEMYYTMIDDWKRIKPDIKTIYIFPENLDIPKRQTKKRNLLKEKEEERIKEIEEQYNLMKNDKNMQAKFDYILYNKYDQASLNEIINLVKGMKNG